MHGSLRIVEQCSSDLTAYATVPIAFEVCEVLDARALEALSCGMPFESTPLNRTWIKDYDTCPGHHPTEWPDKFDLTEWIFLGAFRDAVRMGCAAAVAGASARELLDHSSDAALLWDLRVDPRTRRSGTGSALLARVEAWALARGARRLCVETQQINVPAFRFYVRHGFRLIRASPGAYPAFPDEIRLILEKKLEA
ncbi:MAG: GNAT family N-acetyltransferase [Planctomycetes bacterium]|nr:GNAT family N-acetyltransferase [Planctomycetota bacterium]